MPLRTIPAGRLTLPLLLTLTLAACNSGDDPETWK